MTPQQSSPEELSGVAWRISSFSDNGGPTCVEAGPLVDGSGRVAVRHSHYPRGTVVVYARGEWAAFTAAVRAGEFGDPH
ncbi:DUF397 domain-containing protein [Halostreptopolyspora alba]|uniref:DUF397 domain-containing protein n=1 Tax=Halostreptopolyspora alba TaxID=2487137 RepID=A0A3N0EEX9_9ACTN|nr:DUF397 domain-containing protein [Nocardiopsaceae bacterium YIM 96095]